MNYRYHPTKLAELFVEYGAGEILLIRLIEMVQLWVMIYPLLSDSSKYQRSINSVGVLEI